MAKINHSIMLKFQSEWRELSYQGLLTVVVDNSVMQIAISRDNVF
jgi:hypothetical protein